MNHEIGNRWCDFYLGKTGFGYLIDIRFLAIVICFEFNREIKFSISSHKEIYGLTFIDICFWRFRFALDILGGV